MHDQLTTVYDDLPADRVQDQTHTINVRKDHTQIKDIDETNQASQAAELIGDALRESAKGSSGRKLQGTGTKKSCSKTKSSSKKCSNEKKTSSSVLKNAATLGWNAGRVEEHPKVCSNLWTPTFEEKGWEERCKKSGKMCPSAAGCTDSQKTKHDK